MHMMKQKTNLPWYRDQNRERRERRSVQSYEDLQCKQDTCNSRGAGTGLSGGVLPQLGGSVGLFWTDRTASWNRWTQPVQVVEPGCYYRSVSKCSKRKRTFPTDPAAAAVVLSVATLPKTAAGPKAVKYGTWLKICYWTSSWCLPMERSCTGANVLKNSTASYNLTQLLNLAVKVPWDWLQRSCWKLLPHQNTTC